MHGAVYWYKLVEVDLGVVEEEVRMIRVMCGGKVVSGYFLYPAYPNPFNMRTAIRYDLPVEDNVRLSIYDISARLVRRLDVDRRGTGGHIVLWDGRDDLGREVSGVVYIYELRAGGFVGARKVVLLK